MIQERAVIITDGRLEDHVQYLMLSKTQMQPAGLPKPRYSILLLFLPEPGCVGLLKMFRNDTVASGDETVICGLVVSSMHIIQLWHP
jgi:hypothetical protein